MVNGMYGTMLHAYLFALEDVSEKDELDLNCEELKNDC